MSLTSYSFLLYIGALFALYYALPGKFRWQLLLIASYVFYAICDLRLMIFMVLTTAIVFYCGLLTGKTFEEQNTLFKDKSGEWLKENKKQYIALYTKKRRRVLIFALLANFGILAFFKYAGPLFTNILPTESFRGLNLLLPLGISFYTFQALGYIIDVYRGKYPPDKNIAKFALFVSFFPQIIQGPISRYDQLAPQLYEPHKFDYSGFKQGLYLIAWGFLKKLVVADRIAILVNAVLPNYTEFSGAEIGITVLFFVFQVYADFSGGIDITRGAAKCLGIDMVQNFERPMFAISISDYWRRWHITLGSWMKDYLLYPVTFSKGFARLNKWSRKHLGGYFGKIIPTCLAMALVFFVVGIWHGTGFKNLAFGFYNGGLIVIGILLSGPIKALREKHPKLTTDSSFVLKALAIIGTFALVFIGKYFAAASSFTHAVNLLKATFLTSDFSFITGAFFRTTVGYTSLMYVFFGLACLFTVEALQESGKNISELLNKRNIVLRWAVYIVVIMAILLFRVSSNDIGGFMYANF